MDLNKLIEQREWHCRNCGTLIYKASEGSPESDRREVQWRIQTHEEQCPAQHHHAESSMSGSRRRTKSIAYAPPRSPTLDPYGRPQSRSSPYSPAIALAPSPALSSRGTRTSPEASQREGSRRERHAADQLRRMAAQRKAELEEDRHTTNVSPDSLTCKRCGLVISLPGPYHTNPWVKHKRYCSKIRAYDEAHHFR